MGKGDYLPLSSGTGLLNDFDFLTGPVVRENTGGGGIRHPMCYSPDPNAARVNLDLPDLFRLSLQNWRLDKDGVIPRQVADRGVDQSCVLPYYPYRDDGCALYNAIERYVRTVVESAYSEPGSLQADHELQQWRRELTRAREEGGVGLLGVAGDDTQGQTCWSLVRSLAK